MDILGIVAGIVWAAALAYWVVDNRREARELRREWERLRQLHAQQDADRQKRDIVPPS